MRGLIAPVLVLGMMGCVRLVGDDGDELIDGAVNPPDLTRDQALTDHLLAPLDGPQTKPDGPQTKLDGPQTKPDKGGSVCSPNTVPSSVGFKALLCVSTTLSYDQCNAHNLCNKSTAGLCTANQYQNRIKSGISTPAWIAGCIRQGATPVAPKSATCGVCTSFVTTNAEVEWLCSSGSLVAASTHSHLGLVAHTDCRRVGDDLVSTEGFWKPSPTGTKLKASVCCY